MKQRNRDKATFCPFVTRAFTAALLLLGSMPLHADTADRPDFEGTWLGWLIIFEDPRWRIADLLCTRGCTVEAFQYLQRLLEDPANDDRSLDEIEEDVLRFIREQFASLLTSAAKERSADFDTADDPVNRCEPVGLIQQVTTGPTVMPMKIEQYDDRVVFRYEYWNTVRTIYMDGRDHPVDLTPTRLGHAIGWYDGETLVVETRGFAPNIYARLVNGLTNTTQAVTIERYTKSADGNRLELEQTVIDPFMLRRPLVKTVSWLSMPDMEFQEFICAAVSGEV